MKTDEEYIIELEGYIEDINNKLKNEELSLDGIKDLESKRETLTTEVERLKKLKGEN